jgi:hypothetical protein
VPLLDLYFNKRLADSEAQLYKEVLQVGPREKRVIRGQLVRKAYNRVYHRFRRKRKGLGPRP